MIKVINSVPVESWLEQDIDLRDRLRKTIKQELQVLETRYATLKKRILLTAAVRGENEPDLSSDDIRRLIDPDTNDRKFEEQIARISSPLVKQPVAKQAQPKAISSLWNLFPSFGSKSKSSSTSPKASEEPLTRHTIPVLPQQDDITFAKQLQALVKENGVYKSMVDDVKLLIIELLSQKIKRLESSILPKVKEILVSANRKIGHFDAQQKQEELGSWSSLREKVQECLLKSASQINNGYGHLPIQYLETNRKQHHASN
jgi:hypothetical protein